MKDSTYRNTRENPCNMCMPMGGIIPFKGLEQAMVLIHGSQGCSTYMRRHMAEHFNEPIDVGSSSLNEKGTVYGGERNLKQGLDNLIKVYKPKVIGVLTTCLAETIGEDIDRITSEYLAERGFRDLSIVTVPTPGYGDSHSEGFWLALKRIVTTLAVSTEPHAKINVLVPNLSPADLREIKRILQVMNIDFTLLPDFSDTLDRPFTRPYTKIAPGGTMLSDIATMSGATATIQIGITVDENFSPGRYLEETFGVPLYNLPIPMGMAATDLFIKTLHKITGQEIPDTLKSERGRLLDCMIDSHKYNFEGRSVIFGDPELVYAMTKTCLENGIHPLVIATGSRNSRLQDLLQPELDPFRGKTNFLIGTDFSQIKDKAKTANIALGHSDGRFLTEKDGIPLVRMGFPIHDRVGGQRLLSVGYTGTTMFLDRVTNTLLETKHTKYRRSIYDQFYLNP